ncbi:ATP-binding cassette domain-containing protein [Massilia terrae]|uniref:ATP-binding cassette domain-containing protein n=1 Tax=Massilia terrae TaxID=1811224 RepID=A0ABT2CVW9_9BURK|nr:ATP-binding cassette domain-containing protein [Massilia terrae]MCS0657994.1 ATP-binding cassette domain-containing protein [Massilia terrae]
MANSFFAALHGVHFQLPDGTQLFSGIDETFSAETVGIIGHNGSGKSTLGKLLSGDLAPGSGRIERATRVRRVSQESGSLVAASLAEVAGLDRQLAALARLQGGEALADDFDIIGDQWDIEARWLAMLERAGLHASMAPASLSGGQRMLLALAGGFCSDAGLLVLDEPSNHLDAVRRAWLLGEIVRWRAQGRGLVLVSHDRALLAHVDRIIETRPPGLRRYGGAWAQVEAHRESELQAAGAKLERARTVRDREQSALRDQAERAARRDARGARDARQANQAKLLLGLRQDKAEQSSGARMARQAQREQELRAEVADAFAALQGAAQQPEFPELVETLVAQGQESLVLEELLAPWGWSKPLTWAARGPVRVAITGPNGCGKSTLLRIVAGELAPASGSCRRLHATLLDQSLRGLDPALPLLEQFERRVQGISEGRLRQHLAKAGIGSEHLRKPCGELSGGEQMRAALLLAMLGQPPARMLLLDEPTNHLDLAAIEALEHMLRSWTGALVVVSHDDRFLGRLDLTHRIRRDGEGWMCEDADGPWVPACAGTTGGAEVYAGLRA